MTDQMFKDVVSIILIGVVVLITWHGGTVDPTVKEWAEIAFGFLFGFRSAGYTVGNTNGAAKGVSAQITPNPKPSNEV